VFVPEPIVTESNLEGVLVVTPAPVRDERGFFVRTMSADVLLAAGIDPHDFVQENQSRSGRGTLRGLHGRRALSENKLVRCARGRVFEVIVDMRPWSSTFLQHETVELDDEHHRQVYVPAGCVHGFQALADHVDICYKHDAYYDPSLEIAVAWDDPQLAIAWPMEPLALSERDRTAPRLADVVPKLTDWYGARRPAQP
jgi:dTDP-4-dehydrorhamnose 3,5-epimerase